MDLELTASAKLPASEPHLRHRGCKHTLYLVFFMGAGGRNSVFTLAQL